MAERWMRDISKYDRALLLDTLRVWKGTTVDLPERERRALELYEQLGGKIEPWMKPRE